MKKKIVALVVVASFCLFGCSPTQTGTDELMAPPKLSVQQTNIYNALEQSSGKNIKLKYPKKGEFTSAFLVRNLDNEPTDEAIVFYEAPNAQNATLPLRMSVLDQREGKWVSTYETGVEASEVEKVSFITTDDVVSVIIGFNQTANSEKLVKQYNYNNGILNEVSTVSCNNFEVFDFDADIVNEIVTISAKSGVAEQRRSIATLYEIGAKGFVMQSSVSMDPTVTEYINVNGGKLENGKPALYLDGVKSAAIISTEVIVVENGKLSNLVYNRDPDMSLVDKTVRPAGLASLDFAKKGIYYIPQSVVAPGYEIAPKYQAHSFTEWYSLTYGALQFEQTSYVDYKLGFIFTMPEVWIDRVTIEKSSSESEVLFYRYKNNASDNSEKILSIKAIKKTDYNKSPIQNTHRILKDNGQLMYLYQVFDDSSELGISEGMVRQCFNLLHGGVSNEKNPGM